MYIDQPARVIPLYFTALKNLLKINYLDTTKLIKEPINTKRTNQNQFTETKEKYKFEIKRIRIF